ncbi:MAG: hypothetical protein ABW215_09000, partial [Kibdelosporangium sp.]
IVVLGQEAIRRDLGVDRFFAHADVLSGQRVGEADIKGRLRDVDQLGATFQLVEEVRFKKANSLRSDRDNSADVWTGITARIGPAVNAASWDSPSAELARAKYTEMLAWHDNHRNEGLLAMNWHLAKFSALVIRARMDVDELMGLLVKALDDWHSRSVNADALKFFVTLFRKFAELALAPTVQAKDAIWAAYDVFTEAMGLAPKDTNPSGFGYDPSDHATGIHRMLELFIRTADKILEEAASVVHVLITDPDHGIQAVRNQWKNVPKW